MLPQLFHSFQGIAIHLFTLSIWLILLIAIFAPLEHFCAVHPAKFWRKQMGVDLVWYFVNSLLPAAILTPPLLLAAQYLHKHNPGGFYNAIGLWPLYVRLPLMIFMGDVATYWGHRALHCIPILWRVHWIHHSAENLDWLSNTRGHPIDLTLVRLCGLAPAYLLGLAHPASRGIDPGVALFMIIGTLWTFFIHSNFRYRLPGPLEWIISSPAFHHWHHSIDARRETNYAFFFPFIDWIFGTAYLPREWPPGYGAIPAPSPTLAGQFFEPLEPQTKTGFIPKPWKQPKDQKSSTDTLH